MVNWTYLSLSEEGPTLTGGTTLKKVANIELVVEGEVLAAQNR